MKIGFFGLGNMGEPMAANLVAAGHKVSGFDLVACCPEGVAPAPDAAAAADGAEVVITMLPDGAALRHVAGLVIPAMAPGRILLDCSTVDVENARAVAAQATSASLGALDAPVSGGTAGAEAGTLTFMVGGEADLFDTARPLFRAMGARAVHCGGPGTGQAAKICNNMILGVTMAATCEAFAVAHGLGLPRAALFDVVSNSSGASWSMTTYCPAPGVGPDSPADNDYRPGFAAALMLKDLRLAAKAADSTGVEMEAGRLAGSIYARLVESADGADQDFSVLLRHLTSGQPR